MTNRHIGREDRMTEKPKNPLLEILRDMPSEEAFSTILDFLDRGQVTVYGISLRPEDLLKLKRFMSMRNLSPEDAIKEKTECQS